eukprot:gene11282-4094_t
MEPSQCKPKKKSKSSMYNYDHVFVKEEPKKPDISIQLNQSKVEKDYTNKKGFEKLAEEDKRAELEKPEIFESYNDLVEYLVNKINKEIKIILTESLMDGYTNEDLHEIYPNFGKYYDFDENEFYFKDCVYSLDLAVKLRDEFFKGEYLPYKLDFQIDEIKIHEKSK